MLAAVSSYSRAGCLLIVSLEVLIIVDFRGRCAEGRAAMELWWTSAGRMLNAGTLQGSGPGFYLVCNSSMLTGQCGMNWAGHSGSQDLGVDGPQCQRQRATGVGEGTIGPKASVNFLNSSGPDLLRRPHGLVADRTNSLFCLMPPQFNPMIPS